MAYGTAAPNAYVSVQIEGMQPYVDLGRYGGGDDLDDSGVMRYCPIRYGAYVLGTDNEINGLTLGAVGRGTKIEHIEVYQNADDAFEWFGGTVDCKYLVAWADGDDGLDWDEGYRGCIQFVLRVQGVAQAGDPSDKGAEMDGGNAPYNAMPSSIPTVYNVTIVGHGPGTRRTNTALHFRDGSGGRWYNSIFMDFGGAIALIEGRSSPAEHSSAKMVEYDYAHYKPGPGQDPRNNSAANLPNYIGYDHLYQPGDKMLEIKPCVFWRFEYPNAFGRTGSTGNSAATWGAGSGQAFFPYLGFGPYTIGSEVWGQNTGLDLFNVGGNNAWQNVYLTTPNPPIAALERSSTPVLSNNVNFYPVTALEPNLPNGSPYLTGGRLPPNDGFFTPITFRGAFDNTRMWAGWTLAARLGLVDWSEGIVEGDYDDPTIIRAHTSFTLQFVADDAARST